MADLDVVLFRTDGGYETLVQAPPVRDDIDLGLDVALTYLPDDIARKIGRACNAGSARDVVPFRYALVRNWGDTRPVPGFDTDERLQVVVALSRLVRPTSIGFEQSAEVCGDLSYPDALLIRPGLVVGPAAQAWIADENARNWLTEGEANELAILIGDYCSGPLPDRIQRAFWFHEAAARSLDQGIRWTLVATGLEALFNADKDFVRRQFGERCQAAAKELGMALTSRQAKDAYDIRSGISHGSLTTVAKEHWNLYILIEGLLRQAIRRGIQATDWRAAFKDAASVRAKWPVAVPAECPTCGSARTRG